MGTWVREAVVCGFLDQTGHEESRGERLGLKGFFVMDDHWQGPGESRVKEDISYWAWEGAKAEKGGSSVGFDQDPSRTEVRRYRARRREEGGLESGPKKRWESVRV